MSTSLYHGNSDGVKYVVGGYVDYANEVIMKRSIPDLRDGLKPVNRRVLYSMTVNKQTSNTKSATVVGDVMGKYHPHGDSAIYDALTRMTNNNGSLNTPLLGGSGNLGKVFSSMPPAAHRYTEIKTLPITKAFTRDLDGAPYVATELDTGTEPVFLPVRYPSVLVTGAAGIAVSVATKIPPFNFWDVVDLTQRYVAGEDVSDTILVPDFPTGGIVVKNNVELRKIFQIGRGRLTVRAKVEIDGKNIIVREVPYEKTIENIMARIERAEIQGISKVSNHTDRHGIKLIITCSSKNRVEQVLMTLYKKGILQTSFNSNLITTCDNKPIIGGITKTLSEWVKWRKKVITTKFTDELKGVNAEMIPLDYFVRLISNPEWRDIYLEKLVRGSDHEAGTYLSELFSDIPLQAKMWIADRRARAFRDGGRYAKQLKNLKDRAVELQGYLDDTEQYIWQDLEDLKQEFAGKFQRKTEISETEYKFSKVEEEGAKTVEDRESGSSPATYIITENMFIKKVRSVTGNADGFVINAFDDSRLIGFNSAGDILRIYGEDIPFCRESDPGVYLPEYWNMETDLVYLGILDGATRMLIFSDGYVSFFDTEDLYNQSRKTKILRNALPSAVRDKLVEVLEEVSIPEVLILGQYNEELGDFNLGMVDVSTLDITSRRKRQRVLSKGRGVSKVDVSYWAPTDKASSYMLFPPSDRYAGGYQSFWGKINFTSEDHRAFDPYDALYEGTFSTLQ